MSNLDTYAPAARAEHKSVASPDTDTFVRELTELSRRTGIGIGGEPTLYVLEGEDRTYGYACDDDSNLVLR